MMAVVNERPEDFDAERRDEVVPPAPAAPSTEADVPEADSLDQAREVVGVETLDDHVTVDPEAPEADALDQRRLVDVDDDGFD